MKKLLLAFVLIAFSAKAQEPDYKRLSETILEYFQRKEFQKVFDQIDKAVFTKLDTARLAGIWNGLLKQNGVYKSKVKDEASIQGAFHVQNQLLQFENRKMNFRLIWDTKSKIKGLYFLPFDTRPEYKVPSYYNAAAATERKVLMTTDSYRIPGTLTLPNLPGKHPLVILIHGSGPNDRDESLGPLKIFRDLASGLAVKGIAVLRFEKRTRLFKSRMEHEASTYTVRQEVIEDVLKALQIAKEDTTIDTNNIFLCGHSFGGMMLPRIAKEYKLIKGLIYLAPNGRKLEDVFVAQAEYIGAEIKDPIKKNQMIDSVKVQRDRIKLLTPAAKNDSTKLLQYPSSYWYDLKNYDPIATAKTLNLPMLFIYGLRDYQTTTADAQLWQNAFKENKMVDFKMYPKLNHFLIEGAGKSTPAEYEKQGNVDFDLIKDIATWISSKK